VGKLRFTLHPFMILLDQSGAAAKDSKLFSPPSNLMPFVEHLWVQHYLVTPTGPSWRVIPEANPNLILVVSCADAGVMRARCCLVGPRSRFADVAMANRILSCGARLRPGALPLLTGFPARDFTDRSVHVEEVFGARGRSLMNRLNELATSMQAVSALAVFLGHEFDGCKNVAPLSEGQCNRVEEMAARTGMPVRTLHSRLMQQVGLPPKRLLRIERLHRVLANRQLRSVPWAQLAVTCGFADQAHIIREFQELLGESPTAWSNRSALPICSRQSDASQHNLSGEA
jgi:AraC-like DNA-binding protein